MKESQERSSLHLKTVGRYWSIRIGEKNRAFSGENWISTWKLYQVWKTSLLQPTEKKPPDNADTFQALDLY